MATNLYRPYPVKVSEELDNGILEAVWTYFATWLEELDITVQNAALFFLIDYADASCLYTDLALPAIGHKTAAINAKKYDKMIAIYNAAYNPLENYDRLEESTHTRTPDLTKTETHDTSTVIDADGTVDTTNKQTATTTTTPTAYGTTTTRSVSPYDQTGYQAAEQTASIMSGSQAVATTYSGDPDHTATTNDATTTVTGDITTTEEGTDTTTITSNVHGNIGVMSSQQMAEQEIELAQKMAIFKVIEQDLAAAMLLQVWL